MIFINQLECILHKVKFNNLTWEHIQSIHNLLCELQLNHMTAKLQNPFSFWKHLQTESA